jgi:hypothetical protein
MMEPHIHASIKQYSALVCVFYAATKGTHVKFLCEPKEDV